MLTQRDILQVNAFRAAYKLLKDLPKDERFITAICQTSDDRFAEAIEKRPELIEQWMNEYA